MNASEIRAFLESFPGINKFLKGILPIDKADLSKLGRKDFYIINTAKSCEDGKHWFVILNVSNSSLEVFCSAGQSQNFLSQFNLSKITFVNRRLQNVKSDTCGKFCCYFIITRLLNFDLSLESYMSEYFSIHEDKNEAIVEKFFVTGKITPIHEV
jgi:hypothetical protein